MADRFAAAPPDAPRRGTGVATRSWSVASVRMSRMVRWSHWSPVAAAVAAWSRAVAHTRQGSSQCRCRVTLWRVYRAGSRDRT